MFYVTCLGFRLGYCFMPYQRLWLYNGAPLVAFYGTLGIRRTYSRLKPPASSRGYVTCNDISVINVTAQMYRRIEEVVPTVVIYVTVQNVHRCAGRLKKFDLRSGSQRHRHFVGFFNVPVQAPTRDQPTHWGYGGHILDLTPGTSRD